MSNSIPYSLMVGFAPPNGVSGVGPTLFVGPKNAGHPLGQVGIGTSTPHCELHIKGYNGNADLCIESQNGTMWDWASNDDGSLTAFSPSNNNIVPFKIRGDGRVIIGSQTIVQGPHNDAKLTVSGKIVGQELFINQSNWADFVCEPNYKLLSIYDLKKFIEINHHLPNLPTQKEISATGNNVAETDAILLRKVEETTLYIIQLKEENDLLKKEIEEIKKQLKK